MPTIEMVMPLIALAPVLLAIVYCDLRHMCVPNALFLSAVLVFAGCAFSIPPLEIAVRLVVATMVLSLGFVAYGFRLLNGGDLKLLTALMLFIPSASLAVFAYVFCSAMVLGTLAIMVLRGARIGAYGGWQSLRRYNGLPIAVPISLAGIAHPLVLIAMQ